MKTTALPLSHQQFPSWSGLIKRVSEFVALTKPRVMPLAVFTAAVSLFMAPASSDPLHELLHLLPSPGAPALLVC
jgi:heme O synthase-like polyprenyltransferase